MVVEEVPALLQLPLSVRPRMYPLTCRILGNLVAGDLIVACRLLLCIGASYNPSSAFLAANYPAVAFCLIFPSLAFCIPRCAVLDGRIDYFRGHFRGSRADRRIVVRFFLVRFWGWKILLP